MSMTLSLFVVRFVALRSPDSARTVPVKNRSNYANCPSDHAKRTPPVRAAADNCPIPSPAKAGEGQGEGKPPEATCARISPRAPAPLPSPLPASRGEGTRSFSLSRYLVPSFLV